MTARLAIEHGRAGYGAVEVLHGVDMVVPAGTTIALLGRNGAGKSTLLSTLAGTQPLRSGRVMANGRDITRLPPHTRARSGLVLVPDRPNVFIGLTVRDNLSVFAGSPRFDEQGFDAAFATFPELERHLDQRVASLSGGERQMLALARILLRPAPVMLLDEVSRGLAPAAVQRLYAAIANRFGGTHARTRSIVVVDQARDELLALADVVYVLSRGEMRWAGEPGELSDAALRAVLS